MTTTFRQDDVDSASLESGILALPSAQPLSGEIPVRSKIFFTEETAGIISGIWESDPGIARWEFTERGEFIHVVSGSMTCTEDGRPEVTLSAGSTAYFPIGWKGTWNVHEPLRKVFVVYQAR